MLYEQYVSLLGFSMSSIYTNNVNVGKLKYLANLLFKYWL